MSRALRPIGNNDEEPTPAELAAIEAEWPLIEAEMALVDAEIRVMTADLRPSLLDWRRLRRAEQRVLHQAARLADRPGALPTAWAA